jgi:hypothetical protein
MSDSSKSPSRFLPGLLVVFVLAVLGTYWMYILAAGYLTSPCQLAAYSATKACTEEAKICPDGSAIGRDPANGCEFAPCPALEGCNAHTYWECPGPCVVCPPCAQCSSVACRSEEFCKSIGFGREWYEGIKARLNDSQGGAVQPGAGEGMLAGKIKIGPICPVERIPPEPGCEPTEETYKAYKLIVYAEGRAKAAEFYGDREGGYSISLPAGAYTVESETQGRLGSVGPINVVVEAGKTTVQDIGIDTGIR